MKKIAELDQNFQTQTKLTLENIQWFERFDDAFEVHGTCIPQICVPFCRMDPRCLDRMPNMVQALAGNTAGIRIRFRTDSRFVALKAELAGIDESNHMPRTGSSGFDVYCGSGADTRFVRCIYPAAATRSVVGEHVFPDHGMKNITIVFPSYNGVEHLAIGLMSGASVQKATPYAHRKPIVFYGSSITQGGCASRPGNAYVNILSRMIDTDIINLGFSGGAKGEQDVARYIAALDMSVFVMDYDHNAKTVQHLQETHKAFFQTIREKHPSLPVVFVSKPDDDFFSREMKVRRSIIFETFRTAMEADDNNVYFIDGERLFGSFMRDSCTVDGCHPNDLGFMRMAEAMYPTLSGLLKKSAE